MKKYLVLASFLCLSATAQAYPTLQLDIAEGTYDNATETIIAGSNTFTLFAYLIEDRYNRLADTYYISAALIPRQDKVSPNPDLGSFDYNGTALAVTEDMVYGIPPLESNLRRDPGDLRPHDIFNTYFTEFNFKFSATDDVTPYNTQDRAKSSGDMPIDGSGMYFKAFSFDLSNLDIGYGIHFDLYNENVKCGGDIDISQFAPFSHDAEGWRKPPPPVPEPSTMILLGAGLIGLAAWRRKQSSK